MMIGPEQGKKASGKSGKKKGKVKKAKRRDGEAAIAVPTALADDRTPGTAEPADVAVSAGEPRLHAVDPTDVTPPDVEPQVGPELLVWIDRVQARVDHLLTLVDPAALADSLPTATPAVADGPAPPPTTDPELGATLPGPVPTEPKTATTATAETATTEAVPTEPATAEAARAQARASSLAEAWARRQRQASAPRQDAARREDAVPPGADAAPVEDSPAAIEDDAPADAEHAAAIEVEADAPPHADDEPFEPVDARLTAVLVARELIARGESAAAVRCRLRDGYGVADPEAVLAQIAA